MVLVDTSVWIRFLGNRAPWAAELDGLLARDEVAGHDLVYGELLIGDSGGRRDLLKSYELMHRLFSVPHAEVLVFVRAHRLQGRGIGWIDAHLIAATLVHRASLWTADEPLARLAAELQVAYHPDGAHG